MDKEQKTATDNAWAMPADVGVGGNLKKLSKTEKSETDNAWVSTNKK
ncbi:MAG: hypothetical protein K0S71_1890 [Clostridia bacterium]|jgi:hypothetical protein|nr:hypothetical protein [Clostridia bacterium]